MKNKIATRIQKHVRGFVIRNIFYRCYNNKNTGCPFDKIRKLGFGLRKKIIYTNNDFTKKDVVNANISQNIRMDFVKIPSPKRKIYSNFNRKDESKKKSVSTVHVSKKKGVANICKRASKKKKKEQTSSGFLEAKFTRDICDGNSVIKFENGTYKVRNNQTGQYILYDESRQPIQIYEQKCLLKPEYIKKFLEKESITEENYRYLDCHGFTKEDLKLQILQIIDTKSTMINRIILNIGKGYHKNKNGERLILKNYLYELQDRFLSCNKNTDPFFCNYPEGFNFSIKNVHSKSLQQTKIEQLLCLYLN